MYLCLELLHHRNVLPCVRGLFIYLLIILSIDEEILGMIKIALSLLAFKLVSVTFSLKSHAEIRLR